MLVNRSLGMLWRAKSCSAKDKICSGGIALPLGANRGPIGRSFEGFDKLRGLA